MMLLTLGFLLSTIFLFFCWLSSSFLANVSIYSESESTDRLREAYEEANNNNDVVESGGEGGPLELGVFKPGQEDNGRDEYDEVEQEQEGEGEKRDGDDDGVQSISAMRTDVNDLLENGGANELVGRDVDAGAVVNDEDEYSDDETFE